MRQVGRAGMRVKARSWSTGWRSRRVRECDRHDV